MILLSYTEPLKDAVGDIFPDDGTGDFAHGIHCLLNVGKHSIRSDTQTQTMERTQHGFVGPAAGVKLPGIGEDGAVAGHVVFEHSPE